MCPLIAEHQAGKLGIPIFVVFDLTQPEINLKSTISETYALTTWPLIGKNVADVVLNYIFANSLLLLILRYQPVSDAIYCMIYTLFMAVTIPVLEVSAPA